MLLIYYLGLALFSKVLERVVSQQLSAHIFNSIYFFLPFQSAFRTCHSTETSLTKVMNDLLLTMCNNCEYCKVPTNNAPFC